MLAAAGVASRRKAEELIRSGRVSVDGQIVTQLGTRVDPRRARIQVDGKPVRRQPFRYVVMNKPSGFITTTSDERDRRTVMELLPVEPRLFPVGRLDRDTEGLLLFTNDGDVANRVMHPRYGLTKEYLVLTPQKPTERVMGRIRDGVEIDGKRVVPHEFRIVRETAEGVLLSVVVHEGMNRIVRRMMESAGIEVTKLSRVRVGPLSVAGIPRGGYRELTPGELTSLLQSLHVDRGADDPRQPAGKYRSKRTSQPEKANRVSSGARRVRNAAEIAPAATRHQRVIAVDGPAAAGKSTVARLLADRLGALLFDTGALYRAVALAALRSGVSVEDEESLARLAVEAQISVRPPSLDDGRLYDVWLNGEDVTWSVREPEVGAIVSRVAEQPAVRAALLPLQRTIASSGPVVMVGRDIGTVVVPDAGLKIYLDATPEERARRRYREAAARGSTQSFEAVLRETLQRDAIDRSRYTAPLRPALDAVQINTDGIPIDQIVAEIEELARSGRDATGQPLWPS